MANKFINMALEFNPKLLILFVREETKRLDDNYGYDLIWEDRKIFSGKSFYLPGSTDVCNKQIEQWNNSPPPLYLWSRSDWSNTHRNIATQHGHVFMVQGEANEHYDTGLSTFSNYLMEDSHGCYDEDYADIMPENVDIAGILDDISDLEYSNESEPDEVRGNKRKYNVSPEDTEPEPSGVESSIPVKKMVNHLFYEASSSKLSSVIMKPQMIRTTQGLMNWSQPVPASGGGSQISSVGATVGDTNIYTNFNCPSANEVKYSTSSGPVNWQTNFEDQPYPYDPAPMQQNVDYNYHPASFPRVLHEPYVPQYMPSGYVNPFASGSTPFFQSATTEDNLPPIPGLGTSARPYPGP